MQFSDIINEKSIIPELSARDKRGVLEELVTAIARQAPSIDKAGLVRILLERERLGTTGIGDGVAIPHGKLNNLSSPLISFGKSREGLDFDSMDGQPTHLFFLLVAPDNTSGVHLQILAKIAKALKNSLFRKRLMELDSAAELYETIILADKEA